LADVEDRREDAGFADDFEAEEDVPRDDGLEADDEAEPPRRANGLLAAERRVAAGEPPRGPSSSVMRRVRPSTSLRSPLSSARTRSSSTSRMRLAAAVTSFARPRVDLAPSAEAVKVRSTAARTASTASAAPAVAWSFLLFFESFFGMTGRS